MSASMAFWLAAAGLVLTCLAALSAKSFAAFSHVELEEFCRRIRRPKRHGQILRHDREIVVVAEMVQVAATVLFVVAAIFWLFPSDRPSPLLGTAQLVGAIAVGTLGLLVAEVWLPAALAQVWAAWFVCHTWPVWRWAAMPLLPLLAAARLTEILFRRLAGRPAEETEIESFGEEIRTIVSEGHREGLLEEDARGMIEGVITLGNVQVSEIMTPRTDMVSLPLSRTWDEVIEFAAGAEHTRIPVFNKSRDDIVGFLHIKDLLTELAKPPQERIEPWSKILREPYFVPETKPVDVLLAEFQQNRKHIAVVLDEYGGVSGLVSMEDVLEEIVGEIVDEYDDDLTDGIRELGPGQAEVLGRVHVDDVNQRLGLDLPEDGNFDTIGGLVFGELGHVPLLGEVLLCGKVRITVVDATSRRVNRVRIEHFDPPPDGAE